MAVISPTRFGIVKEIAKGTTNYKKKAVFMLFLLLCPLFQELFQNELLLKNFFFSRSAM